jgi:hypothetical protein
MNKLWTRVAIVAGAAAVAACAATVAATAAGATPAKSNARATTSCQSRVAEEWVGSISQYRVVASCTSIAPNTEARGVRDVPLYPDEQTEWFSTTGKAYMSNWSVAPFAGPSSRVETRTT